MPDKRYIQDFGLIRDHTVYRLINPDRNKKLLENSPHISFLDLSIVFHCLTGKEQVCTSSNLICNTHFAQWGVPLNMLYEAASENTQRMLGYRIQSMHSVMCEMMEENPKRFDGSFWLNLKNVFPYMWSVIKTGLKEQPVCCIRNLLRILCRRLEQTYISFHQEYMNCC